MQWQTYEDMDAYRQADRREIRRVAEEHAPAAFDLCDNMGWIKHQEKEHFSHGIQTLTQYKHTNA